MTLNFNNKRPHNVAHKSGKYKKYTIGCFSPESFIPPRLKTIRGKCALKEEITGLQYFPAHAIMGAQHGNQ